MAEPTKQDKVLSPDNSFDIVSANSSFSVIDPIEAPQDLEYQNGKELPPLLSDDSSTAVLFALLKGEQDLFRGHTADGLAVLTNYRFFHKGYSGGNLINVPLGVVGHIQASGGVLFLFCKNARSYSLAFHLEEIDRWVERIRSKLDHLEKKACFAFSHFLESTQQENVSSAVIESSDSKPESLVGNGEKMPLSKVDNIAAANGKDNCQNSNSNGDSKKLEHDFNDSLTEAEAKRMRFNLKDIWRISYINECYAMCKSYPRHIIVPVGVSDFDLIQVAKYRRAHRIPAVVWRHKGNGKVIARSSQPARGLLGYLSPEDQKCLAAIHEACLKDEEKISPGLLIVDARSLYAAWGNRLGNVGGHEAIQYYSNCEIEFMKIGNIHAMRKSLNYISALCATPDQVRWLSQLEYTNWMNHISTVLKAALVIVKAIEDDARPVLVHCSDGWDRTSQLTSLSQLMLDPYYRTMEGFQVLVEREWLEFGHKFADRCGHWNGTKDEDERSPVFLQWLDCVFQLQLQFPFHFEFNEQYLIRLVIHAYSCLFGTFLCNTDMDRQIHKLHEQTLSVWPALKEVKEFYNEFYSVNNEVLRPSCQIRNLKFWSNMYLQNDFIHQNTFKMLPSKEEFESKDNSSASDVPKRKTSSPKEDMDPTKSNPLETSDIADIKLCDKAVPEIIKLGDVAVPEFTKLGDVAVPEFTKLGDVAVTEFKEAPHVVIFPDGTEFVLLPEDLDEPNEDYPEQSSGSFAPLDMLASILPNMYSMYEGLCNLVPSFPYYEGTKKDQSGIPEAELVKRGRRSRNSSCSKWVFEVEKKSSKECVKVLEFDGLFIQTDIVSAMAKKISKKNKACCCKHVCDQTLPESHI